MEILKEHKQFRNQLIIITLICFCVGWFMPEMIVFGIIFGLLSIWNILTYRENVKDYNKLKSDK